MAAQRMTFIPWRVGGYWPMVRTTTSPLAGHVRVLFELPAALWADRVCVMGDFNQWCSTSTPLVQARDGVWRVLLDLPASHRYHFRYLVNGEWCTEFQGGGLVSGAGFDLTSVLSLA
jgi:hypothetical protein